MGGNLLQQAAREHGLRKRQVRNLVILMLAVTLGLGGIAYSLREVARSQPAPTRVAIDPANLPPIQPGPAK